MSRLDDKNLEASEVSGDVARAKLYQHLAFKGYIVVDRDDEGPLRIFVDSYTALQEWVRDSVDRTKGKKKVRDFVMRLVGERPWQHA